MSLNTDSVTNSVDSLCWTMLHWLRQIWARYLSTPFDEDGFVREFKKEMRTQKKKTQEKWAPRLTDLKVLTFSSLLWAASLLSLVLRILLKFGGTSCLGCSFHSKPLSALGRKVQNKGYYISRWGKRITESGPNLSKIKSYNIFSDRHSGQLHVNYHHTINVKVKMISSIRLDIQN